MTEPRILFRDGSLVAVDKPAGWVVHATRPEETADLRAWLRTQPELPPGLEPVHRLDRETSGVVLYAADPAKRGELGIAFAEGRVKKTYLVLVIGRAHEKGVIRTPLAPDHPGPPQAALTRYRLQEKLGGFSLLRVMPETGRKHQVRRHLHSIHLPVVGDTRYRGDRPVRVPAFPGRLWLHAWRLVLPDERVIEAPLPPELVANLAALRPPAP